MDCRRVTEMSGAEALAFVRGAAVLPYDYYSVSREGLESVAAEVLAHAVNSGLAFIASHGEAEVVSVYHPQPWDSEKLARKVGRITCLQGNAASDTHPELKSNLGGLALQAVSECVDADYISARQDSREIALIQSLEALEFSTVDGILKFSIDLGERLVVPERRGVVIETASKDDIPELRELAAGGFVYDRFHNDPCVPNDQADALHADWVENGVLGKTGCGVLVARSQGRVAGFFLLTEDNSLKPHLGFSVGTLVLIAVSPHFRRRGIAKSLSLASAAYLKHRGHSYAEVGTQMANTPASNVYLSSGFHLVQSHVSLRWAAV